MSQTIEAIYENGAFRPLAPVDLPEGTRARVEPEPETGPPEEQARERLRADGVAPDEIERILDNLRLVWGLYDSMTPEQQAIFDEAVSRSGHSR